MALIQKNLWCQILGSSTEGECSIVYFFGEAEICEFDVAVLVDEDIFRFEVSINDISLVKIFEDHDDLGRIKTGLKRWLR